MSFPQYPDIQSKYSTRADNYVDKLMTDKYIPELAKTIIRKREDIQNGKSFYVFMNNENTNINESLCNKMEYFLKTQGYKFKVTYNVLFRGREYYSFK
jgi:hypothetical protein